jgi:hypothetical protein
MAGPIRRRLELSVRIPMRGHLGSLNAAVAGSILLFEAAAQRAPSQEAGDMREAVVGSPDKALPEAGRGDAADAATRPAGTRPEVAAETSGHPRETGGPDESRDGRGPADGTIRAAGGHDGPEEDLLPGR